MAQLSPVQLQTVSKDRWFGKLPEAERLEIIDRARLVRLADGELLFQKGGAPDGWFGLVEGSLKIGSISPDGKQGLLTFLEPGRWVGDISLFDGLPRPYDCMAHGGAVVLVLSATDFHAMLTRQPALYPHFMRLQCYRMRLMFLVMEAWNSFPLEERLKRHLVNLINQYGQPHPDGIEINLRLPQEELAKLLGVTRQRINQLLKEWEQSGWLHFHYGKAVITAKWIKAQTDVKFRMGGSSGA